MIFPLLFTPLSMADMSFITCTLRQVYDEVKEDEMDKACSMNGAKGNECRVLVEKPEGKRPLGRPKRRCEKY
jgi:hypothetical protein